MSGHRGVVCITIDNLGEAAEIGEGTWPQDAPIGQHFTVDVIRRVLRALHGRGLSATFFIEAANAEIYPALLDEISAAGHEVACHAWQHEQWSALSPEQERDVLIRSTSGFRELGLELAGFRPPGGQITSETPRLLGNLGYRYYSPAGARAGISDGLAVIPFHWRLVDAFFYVAPFASLRERFGKSSEPQSPTALREDCEAALQQSAAAGEQITLLFHPMLLDEPEAFSAFESVLTRVRAIIDEGAAECLTMREVANRMLGAPQLYGEPVLDTSTWSSP